MVTILAFIVLGGGTAAAAFVVSSNSQIGPDTIYGHNAPSGANKNVVTNSLTGADVKESASARSRTPPTVRDGSTTTMQPPTPRPSPS